ncbi:MAG: hypothetical protein HYZ51_03360 [Candidatus Doudnabacteria bacterium]|nr:hypothetical protein [Candidatus Doudnabacteria bacterium]
MNTITSNDTEFSRLQETLNEIALKASIDIRAQFLRSLYFYFSKSRDSKSYVELIIRSIHGNLGGKFIQALTFSVVTPLREKWPRPEDQLMEQLRERIYPLLIEIKEIGSDGNRLARFCCQRNINSYINLIEQRMQKSREGASPRLIRTQYEVVSYEGLPSLSSGVTCSEDFNKVMDRVLFWEKEKIWQYDLGYLMKSILTLKDENGICYLHQWMISRLNEKSQHFALGVIWVTSLVEFDNLTEEIYQNIFDTALEVGAIEDAKRTFYRLVIDGGFSCQIGQIPKVYLDKKQVCENLKAKVTPGVLKSFFEEMIREIEKTIEDHKAETEEILHPKD